MRQIIGRNLWLGNAGDLRDLRSLLATDIQAIVELADSEPFATLPRRTYSMPVSTVGWWRQPTMAVTFGHGNRCRHAASAYSHIDLLCVRIEPIGFHRRRWNCSG